MSLLAGELGTSIALGFTSFAWKEADTVLMEFFLFSDCFRRALTADLGFYFSFSGSTLATDSIGA